MIDKNLVSFVRDCDSYVITFHQNPDGDAIGSALGLHIFLKNRGKKGYVISPNAIGAYLNWLPGIREVLNFEENRDRSLALFNESKVIFCLDFNDPNRAGELESMILSSKSPKVLIDHHLFPKDFARFSLHDPHTPATAQLVFELIDQIDPEGLNEEIATCLYTGIMTDTGSFRFPSTNAATHLAVSKLMQTGFNHSQIHENIYDTFTRQQLHLFGNTLLNRHVVLEGLRTSYMVVTLEDHERFSIQKGDTEGLVNYNLQLEGIVFGVLFIENEEMVKISFRSKGDFPANEFAKRYFQGGGHLNAAGGRSFVSLEKTIKKFKSKLEDFVQEHRLN